MEIIRVELLRTRQRVFTAGLAAQFLQLANFCEVITYILGSASDFQPECDLTIVFVNQVAADGPWDHFKQCTSKKCIASVQQAMG